MAGVEDLLIPVSDDSPSGPDLYDDQERQQIVLAFEAAANGDSEQPDWRAIVRLIEAQVARTKDVWLAVYLARAGARDGRLEIVERGCLFLAGLLETFWDTVHPTIDDLGFQGRRGPCESLTQIGPFLGPLKRVAVIEHPRLGSFSGEDIERFSGDGDAADGYAMFRAAIDDLPPGDIQQALDRIDSIGMALRRVDRVLDANAGSETGVNFAPAHELLEMIASGLRRFGGLAVLDSDAPEGDIEGQDEVSFVSGAPSPRTGRPGAIESREDVERAIDAVIDYYRRREPASPVPIALARAKQWVSMDFLSVLGDISPDSLRDARRVLTSQSDD